MRTFVLLVLLAASAHGEVVEQSHGNLIVTANLEGSASEDRDRPVFLVLHGTWAHAGMEIIQALQGGLADRGFASLAPTLSLGESRRAGFRGCREPFLMKHGDAVAELALWAGYLEAAGHTHIVAVGHSRGGAQVALFQAEAPRPSVKRLELLAPMVFREPRTLEPGQFLNCRDVTVPADVRAAYYSAKPEKHTPALLEKVSIPVRVFLGTEDEITQWTAAEKEAASAGTVDIDGAGHFFRDLYLDDVLDVMVEGL